MDSVGLGAQAVEKTAVILGASLGDRTFTGAQFTRGENPQEEEYSEPGDMST